MEMFTDRHKKLSGSLKSLSSNDEKNKKKIRQELQIGSGASESGRNDYKSLSR
jgi:hypothetical protein